MQCGNNIRQLGLALHNFHSAHGRFPSGGIAHTEQLSSQCPPGYSGGSGNGGEYQGPGWSILILPYIEQTNRYDLFDFDGSFSARLTDLTTQVNEDTQWVPNPNFQCPSDPNSGPRGAKLLRRTPTCNHGEICGRVASTFSADPDDLSSCPAGTVGTQFHRPACSVVAST